MDFGAPLHRLRLALGIGKLRVTDDAGPVHTMQLQLSAAETRDATPQMLSFGFHSNAPAGADVIYVSIGGDRGQTIAISTNHPASRPRNIAQGGSVQHDQSGSQILLNNDGSVQIIPSGGTATLKGSLEIDGALTVKGAITATSEVTAKAGTPASVTLSQHGGHNGGRVPPTPNT